MVAWMNREALEATLRTGGTHFWSRSRRALWRKGETSGPRAARGRRLRRLRRRHAARAGAPGGRRLPHRGADLLLHPPRRRRTRRRRTGAGPAMLEVLERVLQSRIARAAARLVRGGLLAEGGGADLPEDRRGGRRGRDRRPRRRGRRARSSRRSADLWFHTHGAARARGAFPSRRVFAGAGPPPRRAARGLARRGPARRSRVAVRWPRDRVEEPRRGAGARAGCAARRLRRRRRAGSRTGTFHSAKGYRGDAARAAAGGSSRAAPTSSSGATRPPGGMLADATCEGPEPGRPAPRARAPPRPSGSAAGDRWRATRPRWPGAPPPTGCCGAWSTAARSTVESLVVEGERCVHDFLYVAPARRVRGGAARLPGLRREPSPGGGRR